MNNEKEQKLIEAAAKYVKTLPAINYKSAYNFGTQNIAAFSAGAKSEAARSYHSEAGGWIMCKDRLPEPTNEKDEVWCLVFITSRGVGVHPYSKFHNCWNDEDNDDYFTNAIGGKITHWMPLPQAPHLQTNLNK